MEEKKKKAAELQTKNPKKVTGKFSGD